MEQTASELAVLLEGQVVGNPEIRVRKLAKIESAGPGSVSFLSNPEYERFPVFGLLSTFHFGNMQTLDTTV